MIKLNKNYVKRTFDRMIKLGLFKAQEDIKYILKNHDFSNEYLHIKPQLKRLDEFLSSLELEHKHLFKEPIVRSGPVDGGESWGDFYDLFAEDRDIYELLNSYLEETPFGYYKPYEI